MFKRHRGAGEGLDIDTAATASILFISRPRVHRKEAKVSGRPSHPPLLLFWLVSVRGEIPDLKYMLARERESVCVCVCGGGGYFVLFVKQ